MVPSWLHFCFLLSAYCEKSFNIDSRLPNVAEVIINVAQDTPQKVPRHAPRLQPEPARASNPPKEHPRRINKNTKSDGGLFVFRLFPIFAGSLPGSLKSHQEPPLKSVKFAILLSKFAISAPFWRQVGHHGAVLPLTWRILAPRWATE